MSARLPHPKRVHATCQRRTLTETTTNQLKAEGFAFARLPLRKCRKFDTPLDRCRSPGRLQGINSNHEPLRVPFMRSGHTNLVPPTNCSPRFEFGMRVAVNSPREDALGNSAWRPWRFLQVDINAAKERPSDEDSSLNSSNSSTVVPRQAIAI